MRLLSVELKNFRCFPTVSLHFDHRITLIEGLNGSGKSSLVEALYYACYFKSFRTNHGAELIRHGQEAAYIKIICNDDQYIQIGLADKKRVVRFNGKLFIIRFA